MTFLEMLRRSTIESAGYDIEAEEDFVVEPGRDTTVTSTIAMTDDVKVSMKIFGDIPVYGGPSGNVKFYGTRAQEYTVECKTWFGLVAVRSGLGMSHGLRFKNDVGIMDSDYRGTMSFVMTSDKRLEVKKGERFAQIIPIPCGHFVGEIKPTRVRGRGGYGSTGRDRTA
jgi:dUTPase